MEDKLLLFHHSSFPLHPFFFILSILSILFASVAVLLPVIFAVTHI
jgi:hypothetical protein